MTGYADYAECNAQHGKEIQKQEYKKEWMKVCENCVDLEDTETEGVYLTVTIACLRNGNAEEFFDEIEDRPFNCPERWKKKE